jgi:uncharacterized protein YjeT (DUF2065 family)
VLKLQFCISGLLLLLLPATWQNLVAQTAPFLALCSINQLDSTAFNV